MPLYEIGIERLQGGQDNIENEPCPYARLGLFEVDFPPVQPRCTSNEHAGPSEGESHVRM